MADTPLTLVALRQRREQTIALLGEHFARDHLEAAELEELIDRAYQATTLAELDELLTGLPPLPRPGAEGAVAHVSSTPAAGQQWVVAVMGGAERRGAWTPGRTLYVTAVMGGALLDFREARLDPGVTEVFVVAVMGGVEIVVPPGVSVESNGIGIMGGFGQVGRGRFPVDSTAPVLRVSGLALMGGVEIRERAHKEPVDEPAQLREGLRRVERGEPRDGSNWNNPGS